MSGRQAIMLILAGVALIPLSCAPSDTVTIQGAGATFPAPLYKRWFLEYYLEHPNVRVNYQAIGSGAGVKQFEDVPSINFGASDDPLSKDRLKQLSDHHKVEVLQAPMTGGAVALCYNVPGNPQLRLSRKTYVGMALGAVEFWDDDAIRKDNPDVSTLPHLRIKFIRRAESSGTTAVFTGHLATVDDRWKRKKDRKQDSPYADAPDGPGSGKTVQWPTGVGGKGNSGVAALIDQTPGAFGYIEAGYAQLVGLKAAAIENKAGKYVLPTDENARAALAEFRLDPATLGPAEKGFDPRGEDAYPISTFTWVVFRTEYRDPRIAAKLKAVLRSCLESGTKGRGQELCGELGYVALPLDVLELSRKAVDRIQTPTEAPAR